MKNYELFWKDIRIGSITETNWDMRSSGDIVYHFDYLNPSEDNKRLAEYIQLDIKGSDYLDDGDMENYHKICSEAEEFMDLIDSKDWYLQKMDGEKTSILCPIFHGNNEITWQIDLEELRNAPSND